ncbi:MAG: leucine-rich repeat domain-containing protein, partial [Lachnospiraceae bacterium]|nr:leucine-rich repeat domain-containing protein [Lachnospiraceae bacterium]
TPAPQVTPAPQPTAPAIDTNKTYAVSGIDYKVDTADNATVVSVSKSATKVVIPATVVIEGKTFKVTDVAAGAYKNCKKLKSVVIGKNVKKIAPKAFMGCKSLKKITIKSKVLKKVGKKAFKGINKKAVIKVPAKKKAAYTKLLKGKGQGKKVKIKK